MEFFELIDQGERFEIVMKDTVSEIGDYSYTVKATADGDATGSVVGQMLVDDSDPAPRAIPDDSFSVWNQTQYINLQVF